MKTIHIAGGIAIIGLAVYLFLRKKGHIPKEGLILKKGAIGEAVKKLQHELVKAGGEAAELIKNSGGIDGKFGPGTEKALEKVTGQKEVILPPPRPSEPLTKDGKKPTPPSDPPRPLDTPSDATPHHVLFPEPVLKLPDFMQDLPPDTPPDPVTDYWPKATGTRPAGSNSSGTQSSGGSAIDILPVGLNPDTVHLPSSPTLPVFAPEISDVQFPMQPGGIEPSPAGYFEIQLMA